MRRIILAVLLLTLALGQAVAAPAEGEIRATSPPSFPRDTATASSPEAALLGDTADMNGLSGDLHGVRLTIYERRYYSLMPITNVQSGPVQSETVHADDAQIGLAPGDHAGFMGYYPRHADMQLHSAGSMVVDQRDRTRLSTEKSAASDGPAFEIYDQTVNGAHFQTAGRGLVELTGAWSLKLYGPDFTLATTDGERSVETGVFHPSSVEEIHRWAYLEVSDGALAFETGSGTILILARTMDASWNGSATMSAESGWLNVAGQRLETARGPLTLTGHLNGTLDILEDEPRARTLLHVRGDLDPASINAPAPRNSRSTWGLWIAVATVLVGGAAGVGWGISSYRTRNAIDEYVALADQAFRVQEWDAALMWTQKARRLAPNNLRLKLDEATALGELGDLDRALELLTEIAADPNSDGDAEYQAAFFHARRGAWDEAEACLHACLQKAPLMALEIEIVEDLEPLLKRPSLLKAIREAKQRYENMQDD